MFDIYAAVTDRIITALESGIIPWHQPWVGGSNLAINYNTGKPYSLLNQMLLGKPGEWLTFKQCQSAGGKIRKGEKSSMVVFWKWLTVEDEETGEEKEIPFLRYYNVFHISQCEGVEPRHIKPGELPNVAETIDAAHDVIYDYLGREGVTLTHVHGGRAFYRPSTDEIVLPLRSQFVSTAEFYGTLFHELTHSTGHEHRLNRFSENGSDAAFGSEEYSKEELVAEIGSAALLNRLGIESDASFRNSAAYIQSWLKALKNDKRMIVSAAGRADKAVQLILGE